LNARTAAQRFEPLDSTGLERLVPGVPDPLPSADEPPFRCFFLAFVPEPPAVEPSPLPAPTASVPLGATPAGPELPVVEGPVVPPVWAKAAPAASNERIVIRFHQVCIGEHSSSHPGNRAAAPGAIRTGSRLAQWVCC
jgi:hypothetical protein